MESSHGVFIRMLLQRSFPLQHSLRAAQTHKEGDRRGGGLHCSTTCHCGCPNLAVAAEFPGRVCNMAGEYSRGADKQQLLLATGAVPRQGAASRLAWLLLAGALYNHHVVGMHTYKPVHVKGVSAHQAAVLNVTPGQVMSMTLHSHLTPMQTSSSVPRDSSPADWRTSSLAGWAPSRLATPQVLFVFQMGAGCQDSDGWPLRWEGAGTHGSDLC